VQYKGVRLDCGYRLDILAAEQVIVELKSVEKMTGLHEAQLLTYMKLAGIGRGLLINFNVQRLVDGVKRFKI
jgi:GxxExxY protein